MMWVAKLRQFEDIETSILSSSEISLNKAGREKAKQSDKQCLWQTKARLSVVYSSNVTESQGLATRNTTIFLQGVESYRKW